MALKGHRKFWGVWFAYNFHCFWDGTKTCSTVFVWEECKKSLKIPKGQSEFVYRRRTDNTMARRKSTKGQTTIYKTYI